jgi:transposase-like protein
MDQVSVMALADELRTEGDAYRFLEELRWDGKPICPHCGNVRKHYFLKPADGSSRKTRTGAKSERRVWKCADCRKQFSVLTGTVFHGSKIPVRKWIFVVYEMCASKNGVSAREIERKYDLTAKSAWFMLHRIREAMKQDPLAGLLSGRVVADETWIGGKPKNRHGHKRGKGGQGKSDKTPVMSLVARDSGEVRSRVMPNVRRDTLRAAIRENIDPALTHLHTDMGGEYLADYPDLAGHSMVDHKAGEYVRGDVTTNHAEGYFSQLKRSIDGTHHRVSVEHLGRYLAEFDFRYSTRNESDSGRMSRLARQVGNRRLTYRNVATS